MDLIQNVWQRHIYTVLQQPTLKTGKLRVVGRWKS